MPLSSLRPLASLLLHVVVLSLACSPTNTLSAAAPNPNDLAAWTVTSGEVTPAPDQTSPSGKPVWRVAPGSRATLELNATGRGGEATFWVYDDGAVSADEKESVAGPHWGLTSSDGRILTVGIGYARYLKPGGSLVASDYAKHFFEQVQYLGVRDEGKWVQWTFTLDPIAGVSILRDGKKSRFDWNKTQFRDFTGLILIGDSSKNESAQTLLVSEINASTGAAMSAAPAPAPPPPAVVPETDPAAEGSVPAIRPEVAGKHPRLLFTADDIPRLKAFYASDDARRYRERIEELVRRVSVPDKPKFLRDATDGQRQGFWHLPSLALHYVMTGDATSRDRAIAFLKLFLLLPNWEETQELNSGMSSANIMLGAALAFDWLNADLEPEFREKFRDKLWQMARAQYYGGHLARNPGNAYWQNDPQTNHRWMRDAGLSAAVFAAYEGKPEQQWLFQKTAAELDYIMKYLPEDGSSHEGPGYHTFGSDHLAIFASLSDVVLGTKYRDHSFFPDATKFRVHMMTSGLQNVLRFGDNTAKGTGFYGNVYLLGAAKSGDDKLAGKLREFYSLNESMISYPWLAILWDDPKLGRSQPVEFPRQALFPDVGVATMRDAWSADGVSAMFKCGPFGGHELNTFRAENGNKYINVAHDDPDANTFLLALGDTLVAESDGYSKHKASINHNTVLVNGIGQMSVGRDEGPVFSQPGSNDMREMGYLTAWKATPGYVAIEGEAAGSYPASKNAKSGADRPALECFRRSFFFLPGQYVLVLDDLRAPESVEFTWLVQSSAVTDAGGGRYSLEAEGKECAFHLASDAPLKSTITDSPADNRGESMGFKQLRASADADTLRISAVFDAWQRGITKTSLATQADGSAILKVEGKGFVDEWIWKSATDNKSASTISAKRVTGDGGKAFPVTLENSAPPDTLGRAVEAP